MGLRAKVGVKVGGDVMDFTTFFVIFIIIILGIKLVYYIITGDEERIKSTHNKEFERKFKRHTNPADARYN